MLYYWLPPPSLQSKISPVSMMKSLLSLLVLLFAGGVARAGQAVTCEECRTAAQDFVTHLLSEEGITEQTEVMKSQVCPQVTGRIVTSG